MKNYMDQGNGNLVMYIILIGIAVAVVIINWQASFGQPKVNSAEANEGVEEAEAETPVSSSASNSTALDQQTAKALLDEIIETAQDSASDPRRLDEKFMSPDALYKWGTVQEDVVQENQNLHRINIDYEMVKDAKTGDIVYDGFYFDDSNNTSDHAVLDRIAISVPELISQDEISDTLDDFGVLEVFSYVEVEGQFSGWRAQANLLIFDLEALKSGRSISLVYGPLGNYLGGLTVVSSVPILFYELESEIASEEIVSQKTHHAAYTDVWFGDNQWEVGKYYGNASFTDHSISFGPDEFPELLMRVSQCSLLGRGQAKDYYDTITREHEGAADETVTIFCMTEFLNEVSGPLAGAYQMDGGYNGYAFFYPHGRSGQVIAVKDNTIYLALSARGLGSIEDTQHPDVERDKIFIGTYYEDNTEDPQLVELDGDRFTTLTQGTLDRLLYLLQDANIYWPTMNCSNLGLGE